MEVKPRFQRVVLGWVCESPGTEPGYGPTPEAAYYDWLGKFTYDANR